MSEHKCNGCGGCGFEETIDAEVVKEIEKTPEAKRAWNSFLLFLLPVLIIVGLVLVLVLAVNLFVYLLPVLVLGYIGLVIWRVVKKSQQ